MSNKAQVLVLFARHNETFEEDFVGVALTREQEKAMGKHVDSDTVTCWTERVTLQGWEGELNEHNFPQPVFLVFRAGAAQGEKREEDGLDPEILGAFVSRVAAEAKVEALERANSISVPSKFHIWELQFGWLAEPYRHNGPPVPKY
ncbi:hypothetical protein ACEN2D_09825 [Corynebacterium auriscanis]|uniref:hypothetical protein n=1 Tax=Corynebacterium auriscanis TaxID=99807 RepID=UPI003CF06EB3